MVHSPDGRSAAGPCFLMDEAEDFIEAHLRMSGPSGLSEHPLVNTVPEAVTDDGLVLVYETSLEPGLAYVEEVASNWGNGLGRFPGSHVHVIAAPDEAWQVFEQPTRDGRYVNPFVTVRDGAVFGPRRLFWGL